MVKNTNAELTEKNDSIVEAEETATAEPRLRDALAASRPVKFIKKHKVGVGVGFATAGAAIAAGFAAAKGVFDGDILENVTDAATDAVDAAKDALPVE